MFKKEVGLQKNVYLHMHTNKKLKPAHDSSVLLLVYRIFRLYLFLYLFNPNSTNPS